MDELNDVLLTTILKLVGGDNERCHQLIEAIRKEYPDKSMRWCKEKVIYDLRYTNLHRAHSQKPSPSSTKWGLTGVSITSSVPQANIPQSLPDARALAAIKRKMAQSQPAPREIKQRLYSLAGDWELVNRLVERVRFNHPERSEQWAYEKAIYDLQRDRLRH